MIYYWRAVAIGFAGAIGWALAFAALAYVTGWAT